MTKPRTIGVTIVVAFGVSFFLDSRAETITVVVDHSGSNRSALSVEPEPGDEIEILIQNTCPDVFDYQYQAVLRATEPSREKTDVAVTSCSGDIRKRFLKANNFCQLSEKKLSFTHAANTDSYLVRIIPNSPERPAAEGLSTEQLALLKKDARCEVPEAWKGNSIRLEEKTFVVDVTSGVWAIGLSGGATVSWVTDPKYAVVTDSAATPPTSIVIRDKSAEDEQSLGFAGFVHAHNRNWRLGKDIAYAPTFGLGVSNTSELSVFAGVAFSAGDLGYFSIGWNWRQVDHLPTGQMLDSPPTDPNVLSNLSTRVDDGPFIGFSFKFMSPGESFFNINQVTPPDTSSGGVDEASGSENGNADAGEDGR